MNRYRLEIDIEEDIEDQISAVLDEILDLMRSDIEPALALVCTKCNKPNSDHLLDDGGFPYCW